MRRVIGCVALMCVGCGGASEEATGVGIEQTGGAPESGGTVLSVDAGQSGSQGTGGAATGGGGAKGSGGAATGTGGAKATGGAGGTVGTGGAATTGGSLGSGGTPAADAGPEIVRACSSLPGSGQWERIDPPGGVGDSQAVIVHPKESGTVFVDMHKGGNGAHYATDGLYKSTDCGATWTKMSTGRNSDAVNTGSWCSFAIDPVDPDVIYAIDIYGTGGLWKSINGGVDWDQMVPESVAKYMQPMFFDSISMDPNDRLHLVVGTHQGCSAPYDPSCEIETRDGGATWKIIKLPWGWGEGAGPWVLDRSSWLFGGSGLWLTTDDGASWKDVTPTGAPYYSGGEVENHPIVRGADGTYYLTSSAGIVKSADGHTWSLIPNSGGRSVGLAKGGGNLYSSDEWSASYHTASESDPSKWTSMPPPAALPKDQGAPFLDYDVGHHVLYSSNYAGGLWRVVTP